MKLKWDETGKRYYHLGVNQVVLYPVSSSGTYPLGVAWTGITGIDENPDGAEPTDLYADNIKYATLRSAEKYGVTITAYQYPDEFLPCDGVRIAAPGMFVRQQARQAFGLCWRTSIGNDLGTDFDDGYILHVAYGLTVSPSDQSHETINDSPDAQEFSWEAEGMPASMTGYKPVYKLEFDSRTVPAAVWAALVDTLYGTAGTDPYLPLPDELLAICQGSGAKLTALSIGSNILVPAFDDNVTSYEVSTSNAADAVTATGESGATVAIAVNSATHTSGEDATWADGRNVVTVTVSAADKANTTYTVIVNKVGA